MKYVICIDFSAVQVPFIPTKIQIQNTKYTFNYWVFWNRYAFCTNFPAVQVQVPLIPTWLQNTLLMKAQVTLHG